MPRRLRPVPSVDHVGAAPSPVAACAATSRPSRNCQTRAPAASRPRSRPSSGWRPTTWRGTTSAAGSACPGRWCQPSPTSDAHRRRTPAELGPATPWSRRTSGSEIRRAIATGPDRRGTRRRPRTAARTPPESGDNRPPGRTLRIAVTLVKGIPQLIRFRGHFPKSGYDVQNGITQSGTTGLAVHGPTLPATIST